MDSFPPEITDLIMDECASLAGRTKVDILRRCSLVCQVWRDLSQKRLFKTCDLYPSRTRSMEKLYEIVKNSPRIAGYHQRVDLIFRLDGYRTYVGEDVPGYQLLAQILPLLPNIMHVRLTRNGMIISWSSRPPAMINTLFELFHRPTLESLEVEGWYFDVTPSYIQSLFSNPSLKSISFRSEIRFRLDPTDLSSNTLLLAASRVAARTFPRLASDALEILVPAEYRVRPSELAVEWRMKEAANIPLLGWLCHRYCVLDLSGLRVLNLIGLKATTKSTFIDLLELAVGPNLEHLTMTIDSYEHLPILNLASKPSLRSLNILTMSNSSPHVVRPQNAYLLGWIIRILSTIGTPNQLRKLLIVIPSGIPQYDQMLFTDFVKLLTQPTFHNLEYLDVTVSGTGTHVQNSIDFFKQQLSSANLGSNLHVSIWSP